MNDEGDAGDVEKGNIQEYDTEEEEYVSSFESTQSRSTQNSTEEIGDPRDEKNNIISPRFKLFQMKKNPKNLEKPKTQEEENVDWAEYVTRESKHLVKKCKKKAKRSGYISTLFSFLNDLTGFYTILFSTATFITGAIKEEYEVVDYVIISLAAVASITETLQMLLKYKKRSLYFKQASIQYKRIYRKLNKHLYVSNINEMADYLSLAYKDIDNLAINDHRANFNRFTNSYKIKIQKTKEPKTAMKTTSSSEEE